MESKILAIVNQKLLEHRAELVACAKYIPTQQDLVKNQKNIQEASKLMVLKDKMMFHRACVLLLEDILKEVSTTNEKV